MKSDKKKRNKGGNQTCTICSHPSASPHFNCVACLACAAFFRRSVSLNIMWTCTANKSCTIYHELRMICRACRYTKCIQAGMNPEAVQKRKPEPTRQRKSKDATEWSGDENTEEEGFQSSSSYSPSDIGAQLFNSGPPDVCAIETNVIVYPTATRASYYPPDMPSTSSMKLSDMLNFNLNDTPLPSLCPEPTEKLLNLSGAELLQHYVDELKKAMDRRRVFFTDTPLLAVTVSAGDVPYGRHQRHQLTRPHTMKTHTEGIRFNYLLAYEYSKATPGYEQMSTAEKVTFFRYVSMSFLVLDLCWLTAQATLPEDKLLVHTDGTVSSVEDFSIGWDEDGDECTSSEKRRLFFDFVSRFHKAIVRPIQDNGVDIVEYAALKAFCVWKLGYFEFTNNMKALAKEHETALLIGLNSYYDDREDKAERLGNIILLMGTIFEMYQEILEAYMTVDFFNLATIDSMSKVLLTM